MNDFINWFTSYVSQDNNMIKLIAGAVILIILLLFKNQISKGILNLTAKMFFKNQSEKKEAFVTSLLKPLSYFLLTIGTYIAVSLNYIKPGITKFFKIILIMIVCWGIINYLSNNILFIFKIGNEQDSKPNTTAMKFIANLLKILIISFTVVMVISELGYNINGLLTGIGVGGLAISLAAQDAVSNMISGFIIIFDKPFLVGDLIETESIKGYVEEVTMRTTRIRTLDDSLVTVPNSTLTKEAVTNISRMDKRMIKLSIGLLYNTPNDVITKCCNEIRNYLNNNKKILPEPIRVHFTEFENSSLKIDVVCYTDTSDKDEYLQIKNELNLNIKSIVESNNTDFAYPTTTVIMN